MTNKDKISEEKIKKYLKITEEALGVVKIKKDNKIANEILDMATRYFNDAQHYFSKGDYITAFAAVNYAHGWLDAGARAGFFEITAKKELFTID